MPLDSPYPLVPVVLRATLSYGQFRLILRPWLTLATRLQAGYSKGYSWVYQWITSEVGTPSTEEATGLTIPFFGGSRFAKLCIFRSPGIAVGYTLFFCAPKRLYEMNH